MIINFNAQLGYEAQLVKLVTIDLVITRVHGSECKMEVSQSFMMVF